ncbi:hypothetical protein NDU88_009431 [Pleurodeles waltl]|uniref:Uncharacterized protein n=1 Tax=Pleurodeles waltl TaxID=8319 RepID=A0AAV7QXJ4_PLEWA|nr:hypothetical protein NDU88_009431 [Pleurodeles waltl]
MATDERDQHVTSNGVEGLEEVMVPPSETSLWEAFGLPQTKEVARGKDTGGGSCPAAGLTCEPVDRLYHDPREYTQASDSQPSETGSPRSPLQSLTAAIDISCLWGREK